MPSLPTFVKNAFQKLANGKFDEGLKELNQDLWGDSCIDLAGPFSLGFPYVEGWGEDLFTASLLKRYAVNQQVRVKVITNWQVCSILKQDPAFQVSRIEEKNEGRPPFAILRQALTGTLLEKEFKPLGSGERRSQSANHRPRIGITWASINNNGKPIGDKSVDLKPFRKILHDINGDFVAFQRHLVPTERRDLIQLGARIVPNDILDATSQSSLDTLLEEIQQLDCLVTISTTTAHIAAALGVKIVLIAAQRDGPQWFWEVQANHQKIFYPTVKVHIGKGKTNNWWEPCLESARDSLSDMVGLHS